MLGLLKKHKVIFVILMDLLVVPFVYFCKGFVDVLFVEGRVCSWTLKGAKCATCGGTRCVQSLLEGNVADAFIHNPMIFLCIVYLALTLILLNFAYIFKVKMAEKVLKIICSGNACLIITGMFVVYTIVRNIPLYISWFS